MRLELTTFAFLSESKMSAGFVLDEFVGFLSGVPTTSSEFGILAAVFSGSLRDCIIAAPCSIVVCVPWKLVSVFKSCQLLNVTNAKIKSKISNWSSMPL